MKEKLVIWWIRRDLRLNDNQALKEAGAMGLPVLPLFIIDPNLYANAAENRKNFLLDGLAQLERDIQARGGRILFRTGSPLRVFARLLQEVDCAAVFAEEDHTPYSRKRDSRIADIAPLNQVMGLTIHSPRLFERGSGETYKTFTQYARLWRSLPMPNYNRSRPEVMFAKSPALEDSERPNYRALHKFPAGEAEAERRLQAFLKGPIYEYDDGRNRLDLSLTSGLSPYLRFGMLSCQRAYALGNEAMNAAETTANRTGCRSWLDELIWREFFNTILSFYPNVLRMAFRERYRAIEWNGNDGWFDSWKNGQTGYPIVDAGMRQLAETGWMHNRARMIVGSFLVKDLLIDWRKGEQWFMENLVDGDLASNNGGWQWVAGVGTDAAPYFRIFNPTSQAKKHDPLGMYIRRHVAELARVPDQYIHEPWLMPENVQRLAGCRIGMDYPAPIVDHKQARARALALYKG